MLALQLLSCCVYEAATNQGVPETAQKSCDVYTSMLILISPLGCYKVALPCNMVVISIWDRIC